MRLIITKSKEAIEVVNVKHTTNGNALCLSATGCELVVNLTCIGRNDDPYSRFADNLVIKGYEIVDDIKWICVK